MAQPPIIEIGFTHISITKNKFSSYDCNRITFINMGTQNVTFDAIFVLTPGASITYPPDYPNELNKTKYNIVFDNDQLAGCNLVAVIKNIMKWP